MQALHRDRSCLPPMDLIFAYLAGLLTLINPCVLPILPIVLASSTHGHRHGPAALALGMSVAFVTLGLFVLVLGSRVGINETTMVTIGAWAMIGFGLILLVPGLSARFATATAGLSGSASMRMDALEPASLRSQFVGGTLLGAVWSPCVGPTLGGAISLASQGQSLSWAAAIMVSFAMGISSVILALGYGTREAIRSRRDAMQRLATRARPIMGAVFLLVGLMIVTRTHHVIESFLLDILPGWLIDLSVTF